MLILIKLKVFILHIGNEKNFQDPTILAKYRDWRGSDKPSCFLILIDQNFYPHENFTELGVPSLGLCVMSCIIVHSQESKACICVGIV